MKMRIAAMMATLAMVLLVSSGLAMQPVKADGALISLPAAAISPDLEIVRAHLEGTCEINTEYHCLGTFNGNINGAPAEGSFDLRVTPTDDPGPVPGTEFVIGEFEMEVIEPAISISFALEGSLRRMRKFDFIELFDTNGRGVGGAVDELIAHIMRLDPDDPETPARIRGYLQAGIPLQ